MKYLLILISAISLPFLSHAQEAPPAVVVVEEDVEESPSNSEDSEETHFTESNEEEDSTDNLEESDSDSPELSGKTADLELREQPDDLHLPLSSEPVLIKISRPKQIEISSNQRGGFELISPWAPKPMQQAPQGWRYAPANPSQAYPVEVKLNSGKKLFLDVIPYTLVPAVSNKVIQAREPGYQPERGYQQVFSVSARLESTTSKLEQASNSLDQSIENLARLVDSLPK